MAMDLDSIIHRWFEEVWNQGREETVDELFAADTIAHGLGEENAASSGPEGFKAFLRNMRSAFPDVRIVVEDTVVQGDKVAARVLLQATHGGEGLGLKPTNRRVSVSGIIMARIVNGKVVESWNSWDQLGLLRQLGAGPHDYQQDRFLSRPVG
jgi:steroid delta-isomerase-like uncharacterized protein